MPALFFPDANTLRLALASGLIPPSIGRAPGSAGFDAHGRLWLVPAELPPREALAALARLGVQALGEAGVPTTPFDCWAELVPLRPAAEPHNGTILFLVPEKQLARFTARLPAPIRQQAAVRLTDSTTATVAVARPPAALLAECSEPDSPVEAFAEQTPGVWVLCGWRHPLADQLVVPGGSVLLLRPPRSVAAVQLDVSRTQPDEYQIRPVAAVRAAPPPAPRRVAVPLALVADPNPARETLWVLDPGGGAEFWAYCATADERLTRRLEAAPVGTAADSRLLVRTTGKRGVFLPFAAAGHAPDPRLPGLFVPAGKALRPVLRVRELARALGVAAGHLVWVEPGPGGPVPHAVPESAFRPVAELLEYHAPPTSPLGVVPRSDPFPLARFVVRDDPVRTPEPEIDLAEVPDEPEQPAEAAAEERGWLVRSLRRLVSRLRPAGEEPPAEQPAPPRPQRAPKRPGGRAERKLASTDALLHGHDRAAHRRELELRLFRDLPRLGPEGRAERWADLAAVYSATGNAADAAVCWLNAAWESPAPPPDWLELWLLAECRAARLPAEPGALDRWLSEPARPGVGRVVAAYTAAAGFAPGAPTGFLAALPRLLAVLDQAFDDVPVRAAWLARLGAARVCDGDALGLARWRDRVLARLADRGPALDLDEPSFLRFHGTASAERFQTAREWLVRLREPVLNWVAAHGGGRLRWAGLDAETDCTAAYAQFMLAWGLGCLGERTRSRDWAARSRKAVARAGGPAADPAAHALLGDLFLLRVRDAQEGRPAKPGLPVDLRARLNALPELAAYAVQRLRAHSRILEPAERVGAFRGAELRVFRGADCLGERLSVLAAATNRDQIAAEADALLRLCRERPTTDVLPRVVLTLLDHAAWLERPVFQQLLDLLPTAIDWTEALLLAQPWRDDERPRKLVEYPARMLDAAFAAAAAHPAADVGPAAAALVRRLLGLGEAVRAPLLRSARTVFRGLRRLGLRGEAEAVVRFLDPSPPASAADRLGVACGWYVAGDEDAAHAALDHARDQLVLAPSDARSRTALALAYAEALGFAPPRIALGRLEELFRPHGTVEVFGSTNGWFTLRPLQLIDAVVRSVVTDEFALGPAVRGWLDDDEFLIRGRVHRDLAAVLREQGLG